MIFDFNPWQLDVDVDLTKQLYKKQDYSSDKKATMEFIDSLTSKQQQFFHSLGVDVTKIEVDKKIYDLSDDEEALTSKLCRTTVNFLIRGKILALPKYQKDIYSDEDVFGSTFPDTVKVSSFDEDDFLKTYDNGIGAGIVFKHPCFHYDDEQFKQWDCGYILGSILIMKDL